MSKGFNSLFKNSSERVSESSDSQVKNLISIRDVYLILRRGLSIILVVSFVIAALTFLYFSFKQDVFEATATAVVSPSGLDIRNGNGISYSPQTIPSFETYKSLAYSDPVVISVIETGKEQFPDLDLSVQVFKRRANVEKIYGPLNNRPDTSNRVTLAISQKIRHEDPAISVALTNAWTVKTIETVRDTLSSSLNDIDSLTATSFEEAKESLELVQNALKESSASVALDVLDAQAITIGQNIADQKAELSITKTELEVARELQKVLLGQNNSTVSKESLNLLEIQLNDAENTYEKAYTLFDEFELNNDLLALEVRSLFLSIQLAEFKQLLVVARASENGVLHSNIRSEDLVEAIFQNGLLDNIDSVQVGLNDVAGVDREQMQEQTSISTPKNNDDIVTIDIEKAPELFEPRNYVTYQSLGSGVVYTQKMLQEIVDELTVEINTLSASYGPLKLRKEQIESNFALAEQQLTNLLSERSDTAVKNESLLIVLEAKVGALEKQIALDEQALLELQSQRAEAQQTIGTLMIEVEAAAEVYKEISGLEPTIRYLADLAPLSAQVINLASTSLEPIGTGRSLPTVLAFLLTAIAMTVLVFFREAIKV